MAKNTVCVKMSDELKDSLEYDSWLIYDKGRKLSEHMVTVLEKYMETRPKTPSNWRELIKEIK